MAETLQTAGLARHDARKQAAAAVLTALGVVYGDIGTSTLYGLKQAVQAGGAPTPDTVMGIVSVILWSLPQSSALSAGGSLTNGFAPTTTLGCGSWGGNSISENLDYKHLINVSRIGNVITGKKVPTDAEIWAD
jgi:K+ potassium transporter